MASVKVAWHYNKGEAVFVIIPAKIVQQWGTDADSLYLFDIYPAAETPIEGVDTGLLVEGIRRAGGPDPVWIRDREEAVERVVRESGPGDLILTLGAGDVWNLGEEVLLALTRLRGEQG